MTLAYLVFSFKVLDRINLDSKLFNTVIALVKDLSTNVLYLNKYGNLIFVKGSRVLSRNIAAVIDGIVIDGAVNSVAAIFNKTSKVASTTQTGQVRSYIAYFGLFLVLLIALFIVTPLVNA